MNARTSRFTRISLHVIGAAALALLCGQGAQAQSTAVVQRTVQVEKPVAPVERPVVSADKPITQADGSQATGVATDWSSHHMVFSTPGAGHNTSAAQSEKVANSVRYIQQLKRESLSKRTMNFNSESDRIAAESAGSITAQTTAAAKVSQAKKGGGGSGGGSTAGSPAAPTRDWNISLGSGYVAPNMFPAEYTAGTSISGTGGSASTAPTGNCYTDFVVYGLFAFGSSTQANLVGVDDLYSGTSPTGTCGTTPNVKFSYNISTIGGYIPTSISLSSDGTMIAFVETNGSQSVLHVVKWAEETATGQSSVTAPVTPTPVASMSLCTTAPCEVSVVYSTSGNTRSSPFYDFQTDAVFVGDDNGNVYQISGVFYGVPTLSTTYTVASGVKLTSPVYDFSTGNLFMGGSDGYLYALNSTTNAVSRIQVGAGGLSGQVVDAPTVDGSAGRVIAFTAADPTDTFAQVLQADTTTPLGNPVSAPIGAGGLGVLTVSGSFDNLYYNWSGSGGNTGHYYIIGTAAGSSNPQLYQLPFSGVNSVIVSGTATSGTTNPTATFSAAPTGGITATGTASGGIFGVTVATPGAGYTSFPSVSISGTGSGASASVSDVKILTGVVGNAGSNYGSIPTVAISGGTGETATAALGIDLVTVANGSGGTYTSIPTASFPGGSGVTSKTSVGLQTIGVTTGGSYSNTVPTVSFTGGTGTAASATASMGVGTVTVSAGGSNYTSIPTVTFSGGGGGSGAMGTAALGIDAGTASGGSYTSIPTVGFPGGTGAGGAEVGLQTIGVSNGGSGFTAVPGITISGTLSPGGSAATTQASVGLNAVPVTAQGSGYSSLPTVNVNGGTVTPSTGTAATATAALGLAAGTYAVSSGGTYTSIPIVTASGGSGAPIAYVGLQTINLTGVGSGYTSVPTAAVSGGTVGTGGSAATVQASVGLNAVAVSASSGYTSVPTVSITGGTGTSAASASVPSMFVATATFTGTVCYSSTTTESVSFSGGGGGSGAAASGTPGARGSCGTGQRQLTTISVTAGGSGYTSLPTALVPQTACVSGCSTALTITLGVSSVTVGSAGSYTAVPTVTIPGGTTTVAATYKVVGVAVATPGNYSALPSTTIGFSGGGGSGAAASISAFTVVDVNVPTAGEGTGYTSGPVAVSYAPTGATGPSIPLGVVSVTPVNAGSYTTVPTSITLSGGGGSLASLGTATYKVVSVAVTAPGSYITTIPTAATNSGGGSGATLAVTAVTVVGVNVTSPGTGYTTGPINLTFSSGTATGTADLKVVSVTASPIGSGYTSNPTVGFGSGSAAATATLTVATVNVTAPGSYTVIPTAVKFGSGTAAGTITAVTVVSVAVTAPGTGFTSGPVTVGFTGGGATVAGTGSADLKVVSLAVAGSGGDYTSFPTATLTDPSGTGSGATATFTVGVLKVGLNANGAGTGYSGTPTVSFTGGGGTTQATGTATIAVNAVSLAYGGGGYSTPPTVTISGSPGVTATATINPGSTITAGTPTVNAVVVATALVQSSPVSDVYDPGTSTDFLFYGYGNSTIGDVATRNITGGTISAQTAVAEPPANGGTSGIVVDPVTTGGVQANSIYFATLGAGSTDTFAIATFKSSSSLGASTATITTQVATDFPVGSNIPITVAGVTCSGGCNYTYNGNFTGTVVSSTKITYQGYCSFLCAGETATANTGTVTDDANVAYRAVKLTQSGLN